VTVTGPDVHHASGAHSERGEELTEGVDLGALSRGLAPPSWSKRDARRRERRKHAHARGPLEEGAEIRRSALRPAGGVTLRLDGFELVLAEREEERVPASRDERTWRGAARPGTPVEDVAAVGDEARGRF